MPVHNGELESYAPMFSPEQNPESFPVAKKLPEANETRPESHVFSGEYASLEFSTTPEFHLPENAETTQSFTDILRYNAGLSEDMRPVRAEQAVVFYNELIAENKHILEEPTLPVTDQFYLRAAIADAYAGLVSYTENPSEELVEQAVFAAKFASHANDTMVGSIGTPTLVCRKTPYEVLRDPEAMTRLQDGLHYNNTIARVNDMANATSPEGFKNAYETTDATTWAKAMFHYANSPEVASDPELKVFCLDNAAVALNIELEERGRPRMEDTLAVHEFFEIQDVLGRTLHDIVLTDGVGDASDRNIRRISIGYLENASGAFAYLREKLGEDVAHTEELKGLVAEQKRAVESNTELHRLNAELDALSAKLKPLEDAESHYAEASGMTPPNVASLEGDRAYYFRMQEEKQHLEDNVLPELKSRIDPFAIRQQIAEKVAQKQAVFSEIYHQYDELREKLFAAQQHHIGDLQPGTDSAKLARIVTTIEKSAADANWFHMLYEQELREGMDEERMRQAQEDKLGEHVARLTVVVDRSFRKPSALKLSDLQPSPQDTELVEVAAA